MTPVIPTVPVREVTIQQHPTLTTTSLADAAEVKRYMDRQLTDALRPYYEQQIPVILRKCALHFPAVEKWKDLSYLETQLADWDECHAEMGLYNQKDGEKFQIPFDAYAEYLKLAKRTEQSEDNVVDDDEPSSSEASQLVVYLAQNELPSILERDICIPSICTGIPHDDHDKEEESIPKSIGHGRLYQRNIWIGPTNATSPLHYDPLDNFIVQIVGRKRVYLLDANIDPEWLYAGEAHGQQSNTSAVPIYNHHHNNGNLDVTMYPIFQKNVLERHAVLSSELNAGDILFVPSKWWHSLVALEYSISVNVWWR
jgi:hypothetical protein